MVGNTELSAVDPPPTAMTTLPEELWLKVFSALQSDIQWECQKWYRTEQTYHSRLALSALCRVSSKFHRIAQPLLYRTIIAEPITTKPLLIRTLCERPELGHLTRFVALDAFDDTHTGLDDVRSGMHVAFSTFQGDLGLPSLIRARVLEELEMGRADAQMVLALALLPNIRGLNLTVPSHHSLLNSLFEISAANLDAETAKNPGEQGTGSKQTTKMCFPNLSDVRLSHWDTENAVIAWDTRSIWGYPTVKSIHGFATDWCDLPPAGMESTVFRIESIDLKQSLITGEDLSLLLSSCPDLRSLKISWGSAIIGDCELDFDAIGEALRRDRGFPSKLEVLAIDPFEAFEYAEGESKGRIGSLRELGALKQLTVPNHIFVPGLLNGDDEDDDEEDSEESEDSEGGSSDSAATDLALLLPSSLEILRFTGISDAAYMERNIIALITDGEFRSLRRIAVNDLAPYFFHVDVEQHGWHQVNKHRVVLKKGNVARRIA
ncbi:hypothetical protein SCUP234_08383 [Seiridium cupressi]